MTSAPRSPRICVQKGPASTRERSRTRIPSNALFFVCIAQIIPENHQLQRSRRLVGIARFAFFVYTSCPSWLNFRRGEHAMDFNGRVGIVTGASRGIGRAIVLELARRGCRIAFNYSKSAAAAEELVKECESLEQPALAYQADAANLNAVQEMVKDVKTKLGRVDLLVNNAGITNDKLLMRMKEDDWDNVISTN